MAKRIDWIIDVVRPGSWSQRAARDLVAQVGVPVNTATRWARVRRSMSPAVLKKKLQAARN